MKSADEWAESVNAGALIKFISSRHATKSQEYLVVHDFVRDVQRDALEKAASFAEEFVCDGCKDIGEEIRAMKPEISK